MSKLELQDAVDVGRHTLQPETAFEWPRYVPTRWHRFANVARFLVIPAIATVFSLTVPPPIWAVVVSVILSYLAFAHLFNHVPKAEEHRYHIEHLRVVLRALIPSLVVMFCAYSWYWPGTADEFGFLLSIFVGIGIAAGTTQHYLNYLTAHHRNTVETQQKWRKAFSNICVRFDVKNIKPARDDLTAEEMAEFKRAVRAFSWYRPSLIGVALLMVIVALFCPSLRSPNLTMLFIILPVYFTLLLTLVSARGKRTWHALLTLLHSPDERAPELGEDPGWSAKSPLGPARTRRRFLNLSLLSFVELQTPFLFERLVSHRHPYQFPNRYTYDVIWSLYESAFKVDHIPLVTLILAASAVMQLSGFMFLLYLHIIAGGTFQHAHRILDNDSD